MKVNLGRRMEGLRRRPGTGVAERCPTLHIGVLVEDRYLAQAEPAGAVAALSAAGPDVGLVVADRHVAALGAPVGVDVLLARGRRAAFVSLLRAAEAGGVPGINSPSPISAVGEK